MGSVPASRSTTRIRDSPHHCVASNFTRNSETPTTTSETPTTTAKMAQPGFGYPEGVKITDFVPPEILPLVHEHWYQFPPVNPMWHFLLGVIYIVLGFWSIF